MIHMQKCSVQISGDNEPWQTSSPPTMAFSEANVLYPHPWNDLRWWKNAYMATGSALSWLVQRVHSVLAGTRTTKYIFFLFENWIYCRAKKNFSLHGNIHVNYFSELFSQIHWIFWIGRGPQGPLSLTLK